VVPPLEAVDWLWPFTLLGGDADALWLRTALRGAELRSRSAGVDSPPESLLTRMTRWGTDMGVGFGEVDEADMVKEMDGGGEGGSKGRPGKALSGGGGSRRWARGASQRR
jgi:hypothetical protein